jgi:hypothetical protein
LNFFSSTWLLFLILGTYGCGNKVETVTRIKGLAKGEDGVLSKSEAQAFRTLSSVGDEIDALAIGDKPKGKILAKIVEHGLVHMQTLSLTSNTSGLKGFCLLVSGDKQPFKDVASEQIKVSEQKFMLQSLKPSFQAGECAGFFQSNLNLKGEDGTALSPDYLVSFFPASA